MLNYDFVFKKSKEAKIDRITIEREYWQLLFLSRLYNEKGSEKLFFKGGTAIRFLLGSFRFSEDLDFTSILPRKKTEELLIKTFSFYQKNTSFPLEFKKERVFKKLEEESLKYRFLFLPKNSSQKVSIRIDVSLREKPQTKEESILIPFDYPISPYPLVVHLKKEEILAEKIRALFVREKPRDLFDLWFLLTKKVSPDSDLIKKKFKIYTGLKYSFSGLKKKIEGYTEGELKRDLNQFLPENYRNFYLKLKKETLRLLESNKKEEIIAP